MKRIIITGCFGKMGQELVRLCGGHGFELVAGICKQARGNAGFKTGSELKEFIDLSDVVIDFSTPTAAINFARICARSNKAFVTGTTGFDALQHKELEELAKRIPLFVSSNMSIGIAKFSRVLKEASKVLAGDYDVEILEMHHNQKADAPSGTAKMLGKVVAEGQGVNLDEVTSLDRNHKRQSSEIGFASIRGGGIVGEHHVIFAGENDVITLSHKAISRTQFAHGALSVAKWITEQPAGRVYGMGDIL